MADQDVRPLQRILGTAGHIDHGKTALTRALTGVDTDRLPAEKQRGITIDLGFAELDLGSVQVGLIDVPGHERFVRNMLAGATGFDLGLLIVAADDSVMPQTREHLEILRLLKIPAGVIALTKCDLVDEDWLNLVEEETRSLVQGTPLATAEIVRTSAVAGLGIDELKAALRRALEVLPPRQDLGAFRLAIDRSFTVAGHGTVVTGTVASGEIGVGQELELWPEGRGVRVRGLRQFGHLVEQVGPGSRAAINLGGVHHSEIERGMVLASPGFLKPSRVLSVAVRTSNEAPRPLKHRFRYRLHLGTAEVGASLALSEENELGPGGEAFAQLFLESPVVVVHGQPFVLRAESPPVTLGGGTILEPVTRRFRRRDPRARGRFVRLAQEEARSRVEAALVGYHLAPWSTLDLVRDTGLPPETVHREANALLDEGRLIELPVGPRRTIRLDREVVELLEERVLKAVHRLHNRNPRLSTVRRSSLFGEVSDLGNEAIVEALVNRLAAAKRLLATPRTLAIAGFEPKLSQAERRLKDEIAQILQNAGLAPPDIDELRNHAGKRSAVVPELLTLLVEEGLATEISRDFHMDAGAEESMRRQVMDRLRDGGTMTVAELRDLLKISRKHAVPIGEYLDRVGVTVREGDYRRLAPFAPNSMDSGEQAKANPSELEPEGRQP